MNIRQKIDERVQRHALSLPEGYVEYELRTAIQDAIAIYGVEGVRALADGMIDDFTDRRMRA